jgi:hypothetical protein
MATVFLPYFYARNIAKNLWTKNLIYRACVAGRQRGVSRPPIRRDLSPPTFRTRKTRVFYGRLPRVSTGLCISPAGSKGLALSSLNGKIGLITRSFVILRHSNSPTFSPQNPPQNDRENGGKRLKRIDAFYRYSLARYCVCI